MTIPVEDSQSSTQHASLPGWRPLGPEDDWVLVRYVGHPLGALVRLEEGSCTLGRSRSCDLILGEAEVSRHHARLDVVLTPEGTRSVYLVDAGSTNGSFVNGQQVPPHVAWALSAGDAIRVGPHTFRLKRLDNLERQFHEQVLVQSTVDPVTRLSNRTTVFGCLERQAEIARRYRRPLSVCLLDLDHFKWVNDCFGHAAGDVALETVGKVLGSRVRGGDQVGRVGGEEFLVVLPETPVFAALHLAEDIRAAVQEGEILAPSTGERIRVTCSIGVAELRMEDLDAGTLLARADSALYHAKALGRNRTEVDASCPA